MEALEEARQRQPGAMKAILDLAEKPSIQTHTTEDVHQMREARSSPMPGEQNVLWAIQAEGVESRQLLPSWMASPISKEIYKWGDERQKWNKTLEDRCGKPLTALQSKNYEEWKERRSQLTFLFNKKTHQLVKHIRANANWQKIQEEMLSIRIHLADDLESMRIQAGSGPLYLLLMLRGDVVDTDALPGCLDLGVASGALEALEGENQGPESEDLEEECAEDEAFLQQQEAMQIEEQKVADVEAMADTSDEETVQEVLHSKFTRVKAFTHRPAYKALEDRGLTLIPSHEKGVVLCFHSTTNQWQAYYPNVHQGLTMTFGGKSQSSLECAESEVCIAHMCMCIYIYEHICTVYIGTTKNIYIYSLYNL